MRRVPTHIFLAVLEPQEPQTCPEPGTVRTRRGSRRTQSGMDPKHLQPLAASEKQEWLAGAPSQAPGTYKKLAARRKNMRFRLQYAIFQGPTKNLSSWAAALLGWAGRAGLGLGWAAGLAGPTRVAPSCCTSTVLSIRRRP